MLQRGKSVDTTMGFSTLDGLVMGSRCGTIDPGVVLYLQKKYALDANAMEAMLYRECGLLGISGFSSDVRELAASENPWAREALDLFTFRISREIAALANTLSGLDVIVFTGGIGEHSACVRGSVCERLAWLGVRLDRNANDQSSERIDCHGGPIEVHVIPTDEEIMVARYTAEAI